MPASPDFLEALNAVEKILTADFACEKGDFENTGVVIRQIREIDGARRFAIPEKFLAVVSMGRGVVVSCSADRMERVRFLLGKLSRDEIYSPSAIAVMEEIVKRDGQTMVGPDLKYICAPDIYRPLLDFRGAEISIIDNDETPELYMGNLFPNALGQAPDPLRPRVITAVAKCGNEIAGVAAASADSDSLWQIGVDTLPDYRNRGIGKALVDTVTKVIFKAGRIPYYSTPIANLASRNIASALGYKPAWVELYSRKKKF